MSIEETQAPFRWPVAFSQPVAKAAHTVWETISTPGNLELFHPFCEKNPVEVWPGPESRDAVHYRSGWVFQRQFHRWIEGIGYDLVIGRPAGPRSGVSWRIASMAGDNCTVSIMIYPYVLQNLPTAARWLPHILWLRPRLKSYLEAVLGGLEWYLIQGKTVSPDQFGRHAWFSAPA